MRGVRMIQILTIILGIGKGIASHNITEYMQIEPFVNQPGLYFQDEGQISFHRNYWKTIVYYNMSTYKRERESFHAKYQKIQEACRMKFQKWTLCTHLVKQYKRGMDEVYNNDQLLNETNQPTRRLSKRGLINIVGNIASDLFGVLDNRDAAKYEAEITKLTLKQESMDEILHQQISLLNATLNIIKKKMMKNLRIN